MAMGYTFQSRSPSAVIKCFSLSYVYYLCVIIIVIIVLLYAVWSIKRTIYKVLESPLYWTDSFL